MARLADRHRSGPGWNDQGAYMGAVWMAVSAAAGFLLGMRFGYPVAFLASVFVAAAGAGFARHDGWSAAAWMAIGAWCTLQIAYFLGALAKTAVLRRAR